VCSVFSGTQSCAAAGAEVFCEAASGIFVGSSIATSATEGAVTVRYKEEGSEESQTLKDSYCIQKHSDTFTPRALGYNRTSCELVKCFELKESDGELHRSCLRRQILFVGT